MSTVTYAGEEPEVTVFGVTFPQGEAVDVSDLSPAFQAKLANNPTFAAGGSKRKGKASAEPDAPADA